MDVTLAVGAENNELATWASERIQANLATQPRARRDFDAMRAAICVVAPDRQLRATLRFDHGHLAIHDGMLGVPDLTLCADFDVLTGLENLPLSRFGGLPLPPMSRQRAGLWRQSMMEVLTGDLRIYGLLQHPRLVTRLLRLVSRSA